MPDALGLPETGIARTDLVLLSLFTAMQAGSFFSAALPSVFTIDRFASDARARQKLIEGQAHAWLLSVGMGVVVSVLIRSPLPFIFTIVMALFMSSMYTSAMKRCMSGTGYGAAGCNA